MSVELRIFTEPQQGATYADQLAVARLAEDAGFGAFFRSDHYLAMDVPGLPGPTDAWITLAALAQETSTIRLGTLVTSATFRHPGALAIAVAQVDQMSGGRVDFGLGAGWFAAEHAAYGIPFPGTAERFDRLEESLEIVDGLWRTPVGSTYSFAGQHYRLSDSPALPKPWQSPRPPIIMGGMGKKRTPALAARFADEFNLPFATAADSAPQFERVRAACIAAGRDPGSLVLSNALVIAAGRTEAELASRAARIGREVPELRANGLAGSPAEIVDRIGTFADLGSSRIYLQILDMADLDQLELIAAEVIPQL